jgi:hypothetical protein
MMKERRPKRGGFGRADCSMPWDFMTQAVELKRGFPQARDSVIRGLTEPFQNYVTISTLPNHTQPESGVEVYKERARQCKRFL